MSFDLSSDDHCFHCVLQFPFFRGGMTRVGGEESIGKLTIDIYKCHCRETASRAAFSHSITSLLPGPAPILDSP